MKTPPASLDYHVVANLQNQYSIWPDYRRDSLPRGWRLAGFSGTREACLRHLAESGASAGSAAPVGSAPARAPGRAAAVPFSRPGAPLRLFVFPHAGSGASYYHFLARALRNDPVEVQIVQYPGREMRMNEPATASLPAMLDDLGGDLREQLVEKPCALLGHSMGALTAFELTRWLRAAGATLPRHLFLSGRQAPQIPGQVLHVEHLDDAAFLEAIGRRYNALPAEVLAHRELLELVLPSLRADFTLMEKYEFREEPPLEVPITLLNGRDDPWVTAETLAAWRAHTRHPVQQHLFPGGHFYLSAAVQEVRLLMLHSLGLEVRS